MKNFILLLKMFSLPPKYEDTRKEALVWLFRQVDPSLVDGGEIDEYLIKDYVYVIKDYEDISISTTPLKGKCHVIKVGDSLPAMDDGGAFTITPANINEFPVLSRKDPVLAWYEFDDEKWENAVFKTANFDREALTEILDQGDRDRLFNGVVFGFIYPNDDIYLVGYVDEENSFELSSLDEDFPEIFNVVVSELLDVRVSYQYPDEYSLIAQVDISTRFFPLFAKRMINFAKEYREDELAF